MDKTNAVIHKLLFVTFELGLSASSSLPSSASDKQNKPSEM